METEPTANPEDPEYGTFTAAADAQIGPLRLPNWPPAPPPIEAPVSPSSAASSGGGTGSPGASARAKKHGSERSRLKRASFAGLTPKSSRLLRSAPVEQKENAPPLLVWHRLNLSYGPQAHVIVNASGDVDRGSFVAVLGPSGSGKTSLIDLLSSRKTTGYFTGVLRLDGLPFTQQRVRAHSAFIATTQNFPPLLTVLETLSFVARLRVPRSVSDAEVRENSLLLLEEFGLEKHANAYVGGHLASGQRVSGLSDGQKRRLAIARGVIARPAIVFADEPTRGLDAGATLSVMQLLRDLARTANIGVLCTIHQPPQAIWKMFARVYFLSAGYVMYDGPAERAVPWFSTLKYLDSSRAASAAPAEVCIDLMSIDFYKPAHLYGENTMRDITDVAAASWQFCKTKQDCYEEIMMRCNMVAKDEDAHVIRFDVASFYTQARELYVRSFKIRRRDSTGMVLRFLLLFAVSVLGAWCFGQIQVVDYRRQDLSAAHKTMHNNEGILFFYVCAAALAAFVPLRLFAYDHQHFVHESDEGLYGVGAYYVVTCIHEMSAAAATTAPCAYVYAKLTGLDHLVLTTALLVGVALLYTQILLFSVAITAAADVAYIVATGVFILGFVSSGYPVAVESMNQYYKWVRHYSTLKPPFDAFVRMQLGSAAVQTADRERDPYVYDYGQGNIGTDISIMIVTWGFFSVGAYAAMRYLYKHEH